MVTASSGFEHKRCFAHTLNLVVQNFRRAKAVTYKSNFTVVELCKRSSYGLIKGCTKALHSPRSDFKTRCFHEIQLYIINTLLSVNDEDPIMTTSSLLNSHIQLVYISPIYVKFALHFSH